MHAFGKEVASRTLANVLSGLILTGLAAAVGAIVRYRHLIAGRELTAWAIVVVLVVVVGFMVVSKLRQQPDSAGTSVRRSPSSVSLTLNDGRKPSITLTHHGDPATYQVDGRIVALIDGSPNPQPAPFQCEIQKSGITGGWEMPLNDGEWANVILGSLEATEDWDAMGNQLIGDDVLVVRRGSQTQHVAVPDTGAIVELRIRTTPALSAPVAPKRFRIVKQNNIANVTEVS